MNLYGFIIGVLGQKNSLADAVRWERLDILIVYLSYLSYIIITMPRQKRDASPTGVYHWIARGINRKDLFHHPDDYVFFMSLLKEHSKEFEICIYHYCLMTNHVHLLIHAKELVQLIQFSHYLKRKYAYYQNKTYKSHLP